MPPSRPRLVRKEPLMTRLKNYFDPLDFLLWASEELNSTDLEDVLRQWSIPAGILLNFVFMLARANTGGPGADRGDDVFGDYHARRGSGWLVWFARFIVHSLTILSILNAIYTFTRKRHYRLFEANVDAAPSTPSARRVNVDSSPLSQSPLRYLSHVLTSNSAEARAHPDASKEVWEVAIWDPTPLCLRLFTLFSPGHVLIYWLFLPLAPLDPRPSVTVVTAIFVAGLLTTQLTMFQSFFTQQAKDSALINREVQNEYDTKYVHPALNRRVRDAGTQVVTEDQEEETREVETYTPVTYVKRGFQTNPNPNYAPLYDPDGFLQAQKQEAAKSTGNMGTPSIFKTPNAARTASTPLRSTATGSIRQPQFRASNMGSTDGGSFGIHTHAQSPLRKAAVSSAAAAAAASGSARREGSPLKKSATSSTGSDVMSRANPFQRRKSLLNGNGVRRDG